MRRRGMSPWLVEQRKQVRRSMPEGVRHRIATGDLPLMAWRMDAAKGIAEVMSATGINGERLIEIEQDHRLATDQELGLIAVALRVDPALFSREALDRLVS